MARLTSKVVATVIFVRLAGSVVCPELSSVIFKASRTVLLPVGWSRSVLTVTTSGTCNYSCGAASVDCLGRLASSGGPGTAIAPVSILAMATAIRRSSVCGRTR